MRCISVFLSLLFTAGALGAEQATVWIGTSTPKNGESKGIYRAELNLENGRLSKPQLAAEIGEPGFLALDGTGRRLYAVCRLPDGGGGGAAFEVSEDAKSLTLLNTQPIGDGIAAHISLDHTGRCLFTAQYGGGSVAAFPVGEDGKILPRSALIEHEGTGPDERRQKGPHPHSAFVGPNNRFLFVPDLGTDRVVIYEIDAEHATLKPHGAGICPPGSGPRHMKFDAQGKFAYVLNEMGLSVCVFRFDADAGTLELIQTITTLPEELREVPGYASEICIHPSGKFVYAANRGHDSIAVFRRDAETGKLTPVELEAVRGSWPRNFNIDPSGTWLLAAGQNSSTIAVFRIDPETGGLVFTRTVVNCPSPIRLLFQP